MRSFASMFAARPPGRSVLTIPKLFAFFFITSGPNAVGNVRRPPQRLQTASDRSSPCGDSISQWCWHSTALLYAAKNFLSTSYRPDRHRRERTRFRIRGAPRSTPRAPSRCDAPARPDSPPRSQRAPCRKHARAPNQPTPLHPFRLPRPSGNHPTTTNAPHYTGRPSLSSSSNNLPHPPQHDTHSGGAPWKRVG